MASHSGPGVRSVAPPAASAVAGWYEGADLADAFSVTLPGRGPHDLAALAERSLRHPAPWFGLAMRLRDVAVRPFGVMTSGQMRDRLQSRDADRIDFFPVLTRSEREIVLGEDDRHLDFRLSMLLTARPDGREELTATTVVRCHGLLGRAYLAAILAGHGLVVRSALRQAARAATG
jgi:hypothetical protein